MIQMICLPDLHSRSSPHEQAVAISFYNWRKAVVLASLHISVLFLDSTIGAPVSCSVQGQLELLLWPVQSFFMISLQSGLVLIWYQREHKPLEYSKQGEPKGISTHLSRYKGNCYFTPESFGMLSSLKPFWQLGYCLLRAHHLEVGHCFTKKWAIITVLISHLGKKQRRNGRVRPALNAFEPLHTQAPTCTPDAPSFPTIHLCHR